MKNSDATYALFGLGGRRSFHAFGDEDEGEEEEVNLTLMEVDDLQAQFDLLVEEATPLDAIARKDRTAEQQLRVTELAVEIKAVRDELTVRATEVPLDLSDLEIEEEEEEEVEEPDGGDGTELTAEEIAAAEAEEAEALAAAEAEELAAIEAEQEGPDGPLSDEEKKLVAANRAASKLAGKKGAGKKNDAAKPSKAAPVGKIVRASNQENIAPGQMHELASDYAKAVKRSGRTVVFEANNWAPHAEALTNDHTPLQAAQIMGMIGPNAVHMNKAQACGDSRFINDREVCITLDDELQTWVPKFPMSDECEVRTRPTVVPTAPTLFEWAYNEIDLVTDPTGNTRTTGLVQLDGSILEYDSGNEATWKPVSPVTNTCDEVSHRLRSIGYIREIGRGADICSPAELELALSMDAQYLAQKQSRAILTAMDTYVTANNQVHSFDGTSFVNPAAALAYLFGEVNEAKEEIHGVSAGQATMIMPRNAGALFNVARYETAEDNNRYTNDRIAEIAGVGSTIQTRGIGVTGAVPRPVPAAIDPVALGRTRTFSIYQAWRNGIRQGVGPGVRGGVEADERNMRGNKRLSMTEVDQVNIFYGCLSVVRYDVTLCFRGGSALATAIPC